MDQNTDKRSAELEERIAELEDTLKQRNARIMGLTEERDEERELVAKLKDYFETFQMHLDTWIEAFDLRQNDNKGDWHWGTKGPMWGEYDALVDGLLKVPGPK